MAHHFILAKINKVFQCLILENIGTTEFADFHAAETPVTAHFGSAILIFFNSLLSLQRNQKILENTMKQHNIFALIILAVIYAFSNSVSAQKKEWRIEAESADSRVEWRGDTVEIHAPKGLTLWNRNKMKGNVVIEYRAMVVDGCKSVNGVDGARLLHQGDDRLSDLNCFWMASDPSASDIWKRMKWRGGKFVNTYSMQLYYVGFGGNYNSTTRFRRYSGDERGVDSAAYRPGILREYTDPDHLLRPNRWYDIRPESIDGRVRYLIDGEMLVDYLDPEPLREGWFGLRTTWAHVIMCGFRYTEDNPDSRPIALRWIGDGEANDNSGLSTPSTVGVPFGKGEVTESTPMTLTTPDGESIPFDRWTLARWEDGSVKWQAITATVPAQTDSCMLTLSGKIGKVKHSSLPAAPKLYISKGQNLIDSIVVNGKKAAGRMWLEASYDESEQLDHATSVVRHRLVSRVDKVDAERTGDVRSVIRIEGTHSSPTGDYLPFCVRIYTYKGSDEIQIVHTLTVDSIMAERRISSIGLRMEVPLRQADYNRHVAFFSNDGGVWRESVQPLTGRRTVNLPVKFADSLKAEGIAPLPIDYLQQNGMRLPDYEDYNLIGRFLIDKLAKWDEYRLSQLSPDAFSIRKRATDKSPWIGTFEGHRAAGTAYVGDSDGGLMLMMKDFWQSYPSSIEIEGARSDMATVNLWMWSPEAEPMNLAHYDTIAHDLEASYEDVQEGLSTAYGIARTTTIRILPVSGCHDNESLSALSAHITSSHQLMCTPEYLHRKRAFGIWSLPRRSNELERNIEDRIDYLADYYKNSIEQRRWFGFWNYGDVMHSYHPARHEWRYDTGGFAWDNTELGTNAMLWYNFLRTGRSDLWTMAEAMTRHTAEVDVYHIGPNSGLGTRHNVSHWGCGAKEARISQAFWNRFYYYLTADERTGDLMTEVRDAEQKLYTLDPMRLAQPRSQYPCTAPARLRVGPDWLAYAGNWMTEWERTGNTAYRDKIIAGMKSISAMRHGLFSGPKALGFDPATGIITNECDTAIQNTNHLMVIMGGFEIMNEMMPMIDVPEWKAAWLDHAANYKRKAWEISANRFRIPRLAAYASWITGSKQQAASAWEDLLRRDRNGQTRLFNYGTTQVIQPATLSPVDEDIRVSTNDAATWTLDAIFMMEVLPTNEASKK